MVVSLNFRLESKKEEEEVVQRLHGSSPEGQRGSKSSLSGPLICTWGFVRGSPDPALQSQSGNLSVGHVSIAPSCNTLSSVNTCVALVTLVLASVTVSVAERSAVERIWHTQDSQGQFFALAFR